MRFLPSEKYWQVYFTQKDKVTKKDTVTFTRKRDRLLNPDTCDAPSSKEGDDYQHRSLTQPGDTTPHTPEQIRERRELMILHLFYRWLKSTWVNDDIDRLFAYIEAEIRNDTANHRTQRTIPRILTERFNVDFRAAATFGNEPPSFFIATITDRDDPPHQPFHVDIIRNVPAGSAERENPEFVYAVLVTQVINGRRVMPTGNTITSQPRIPPFAGVRATENRHNNYAREAINAIPDREVRAALFNTLVQIQRQGLSSLTSFTLAPVVLAAMAPANFPADRSVAHIGLVASIMTTSFLQYLVNSSVEIYNYFHGESDNFIRDRANGWSWSDDMYYDDDADDRRLIGYTHDRKRTVPPIKDKVVPPIKGGITGECKLCPNNKPPGHDAPP